LDPKLHLAAEVAIERAEADKANRRLLTFGDLAESYINRECPKLAQGGSYAGTIRRELIVTWGRRPASDLRRRDLTEVTDKIVDSGRPAVAFRVHEIAKRLYSWALDRGEVEAHPFAGMRPPVKKQPRRRVLTDDEVKALWIAWDNQNYPFGRLQQLLLLTGQRLSEVAGMRWSEINREGATWIIPPERSKSRREHLVPLGSIALAILEALPTWDGGDHVFSTRGGRTPVSGFGKAKSVVDDASGVTGWRLHDLRRTCRTRLAALGVPEVVAERVLNHVPKGLSAVYNLHDYEAEKAEALYAWDSALQLIIDPPVNVVSLGAARRPGAV
jgi:integrase